jgi:hypothetical protein
MGGGGASVGAGNHIVFGLQFIHFSKICVFIALQIATIQALFCGCYWSGGPLQPAADSF